MRFIYNVCIETLNTGICIKDNISLSPIMIMKSSLQKTKFPLTACNVLILVELFKLLTFATDNVHIH